MTMARQGDCEAGCGGRRVGPDVTAAAPAPAWREQEALLPTHKQPNTKSSSHTCSPPKKSKFQLRRDKLLDFLTPPYFIFCMIAIMLCMSWWGGGTAQLEWSPRSWHRQPWRLITYSMLHASPDHLAINALVAALVGWRLEREQAWWRVALVWGGGAAGGALGVGALQPHARVVGASAAVYALLTAHLPNLCLRFGQVPLWWFRPLSVLVLGASDVAWWAAGGRAGGVIAWAAHALGAVVGLLLGFLVFTGERSGSRPMHVCRVASALMMLILALAAAWYYSHIEPTRPP